MDTRLPDTRSLAALARALAAAGLCAAATASAQAPADAVHVAAFADRYVVTGRAWDDLDRLEAALRTLPRSFAIDGCGPGSERALLAAAHRFRDAALKLRMADTGDRRCAQALQAAGARGTADSGAGPLGIDDAAVARWWLGQMP